MVPDYAELAHMGMYGHTLYNEPTTCERLIRFRTRGMVGYAARYLCSPQSMPGMPGVALLRVYKP